MLKDRWDKIEKIFYEAIALPAAERPQFVINQCAGDPELISEINHLLSEDEGAGQINILDLNLFSSGARLLEADDELTGNNFSSYRVEKLLGRGGMGSVYLAEDLRLNRLVALKILTTAFDEHSDTIERFQLEARAASNITHQNIAHIYEFGTFEGRHFLAMEYVRGKTLRKLISRKSLPENLALDYFLQISAAIAAAHENGIVHRDIKPENIIVSEAGTVKVLDFGLAKITDKTVLFNRINSLETIPGLIIGTTAYMSPEQIRGQSVDQRTDIWSLGIILYEMLSGKRPFSGETPSDIQASILKNDVPVLNVRLRRRHKFRKIIEKCLQKDKLERFQNVSQIIEELHRIKSSPQNGGRYFPLFWTDRNWFSRVILSLLIVSALAIAGFLYFNAGLAGRPQLFEHLETSMVTQTGKARQPAISKDGRYIAYVNIENNLSELMIKDLIGGTGLQLVPPSASYFETPVFSPDGSYIFYTKTDGGTGILYKIPISGGAPQGILFDVDSAISFSPDGKRFAFRRCNPQEKFCSIYSADSDGLNPEVLAEKESEKSSLFGEVFWLPDNKNILVVSTFDTHHDNAPKSKLLLISLTDKTVRPFDDHVWINAGSFNWDNDSGGLYFTARTSETETRQIWFLSYPDGQPRQVTNDSGGYFSLGLSTETGSLVSVRFDYFSSIWSFNLQTKEISQITPENKFTGSGSASISQMADNRLLFTKSEGNQSNLAVMDENGKNEKKLFDNGGNILQASISPDNRYIVFSSNLNGKNQIWRTDLDGKNIKAISSQGDYDDVRPVFLADGSHIIFERLPNDSAYLKRKLMKISINGENEEPLLPNSQTSDGFPQISPDGKHLSYQATLYDTLTTNYRPTLRLLKLENGQIGKLEMEINQFPYNYCWMNDNKTLVSPALQGTQNLSTFSLRKKKINQITNFNTGRIVNLCPSKDGKRIFMVRSFANSDLVLIKSSQKAN